MNLTFFIDLLQKVAQLQDFTEFYFVCLCKNTKISPKGIKYLIFNSFLQNP